MTAAGPPKPSGWFDRLLELGNHNKIIAAATLVTLATGLPYLVMSAIAAITGEEEVPVEVLLANMRVELERKQEAIAGSAHSFESAGKGLDELAREARNEELTKRERDEVVDAMREYYAGNSSYALAVLGRIADRQERRGDLEAAADTLCNRASMLIFEDYAQALEDYETANDLVAELDPYHQRERGRMLRWAGSNDDAVRAFRKARDTAQESGDRRAEINALTDLGWITGTSWGRDPDFIEEQRLANLRIVELAPGVLAENRQDFETLRILARNGFIAGAGAGFISQQQEVNEDSARIAEVLAAQLEVFRAIPERELDDLERRLTDALVGSGLATVQEVLGEDAAAEAGFHRALEDAWKVVEHPRCGARHLSEIQPCFTTCAQYFERSGDLVRAERSWFGNETLLRQQIARGSNDQNPAFEGFLANGLVSRGKVTIAMGETDAGITLLREAQQVIRGPATRGLGGAQAARREWQILVMCALTVEPTNRELALAWVGEAAAIADRQLAGTPLEPDLSTAPPVLVGLFDSIERGAEE